MKFLFLYIHLICCNSLVFSQNSAPSFTNIPMKPPIDSAAIGNWPAMARLRAISNDGKYFMYCIDNQPVGGCTLFIQSTNNTWRTNFINVDNGFFSPDNRQFIFKSKDTLYFLALGTENLNYLTSVVSYKRMDSGKAEWFAYLLNNEDNELVLKNLLTSEEVHTKAVIDYLFGPNENVLLLNIKSKGENNSMQTLQWIDLPQVTRHTIWSSKNTSDQEVTINGYRFDTAGRRLAFIMQEASTKIQLGKIKEPKNTLWYYKTGMNKAVLKANNESVNISPGLFISNEAPEFSKNGQYIFFNLQPPLDIHTPKPDAIQVDVWNYRDSVLQFDQLDQLSSRSYLASVHVDSNQIIRIEQEDERVSETNGDFALVLDKISIKDHWWPSFAQKSHWLVSLKDGTRKILKSLLEWTNPTFSPQGHYLVYYDCKKKHYYSYDLNTSKTRNISGDIPEKWLCYTGNFVTLPTNPLPMLGVAGWLSDDKAVLIYDSYDIWQLDLKGQNPPLNLTNGYGRSHRIKFRLVIDYTFYLDLFSDNSPALLTAYNTVNKNNGYYRMTLGKTQNPERLMMGPWTLYHGHPDVVNNDGFSFDQMPPLKAADTNIWIIKLETATEMPNYYFTDDLKNYRRLTNLQPQKAYNWLTTELVTWKQLDGTLSQGVLYKPENFDPSKKYPVIFDYYEEKSQNMYQYPQPQLSSSRINIPWFVSRGYLVFTPDIHYSIASVSGKVNGDHVVNSVTSAAQYLSRLPYVNAKKIGIQGHSFGGGETLYLVTHSNMFAAACAAASTVSNEITAYLGLVQAHGKPVNSKMYNSEIGHNKIGATLWQRPDLYIKASPVFKANLVSTPLLIMHNLGDAGCDWKQSAEMFMALRRLGKRAWLLQYDNGKHVLNDKDAMDYTIRINQFFDHYLKDAPAPKWMTRGVLAKFKGIDTGLELDEAEKTPKIAIGMQ